MPEGFGVAVEIGAGWAFPIGKAKSRFESGKEDDLSFFYRGIIAENA